MPEKSVTQLIAGSFDSTPPNAVQLDLREDIPIPVKLNVSDIRDVFKRKGSNSPQAFNLPGTETNNKFFDGMYDINTDFQKFNPNLQKAAKLIVDGEEHINGYIQLKNVLTNDKGDTTYQVTLYDQPSQILRDTKQKFVASDIDWSDLDHVLNLTSIQDSWTSDWDGDGYFYPMLTDQEGLGFFNVEKWQMSVYHRLILDRIIKQSHPNYPAQEYTISGNLPDLDRYQREIIPYSGGKPVIGEAAADAKTCFVGRATPLTVFDAASGGSGSVPSFVTGEVEFDDESTGGFDDSNGLWSGTVFTAPVSGLYKFSVNMGFQLVVDYTTTGSDDYESELQCKIEGALEIRNAGGTVINPIPGEFGQPYFIPSEPGGNPQSTAEWTGWCAVPLPLTSPDGPHLTGFITPLPNVTGSFMGEEEGGAIYMLAGWTARVKIRFRSLFHNAVGESSNNPDLTVDNLELQVVSNSSFRSQKILFAYAGGDTIDAASMIDPNLKQIDVLNDIIARYNAFIYTNPDNENDIVIRTRDDFYLNGPTVDWTEKKDNSKRDTIKMIGELQNAEFLFTYKKAGDQANKIYSEVANGDTYGQYKYFFNNEFVKGTKKVATPFEPTPFVRSAIDLGSFDSAPIVPAINHGQANTGFRVLYARQGLLTDDVSTAQDGSEPVTWLFIDKSPTTGDNIPTLFSGEYPYAGHYDHPITPTFSLNFGSPTHVLAEMPSLAGSPWLPPAETMFQSYWRNTAQQLERGQMLIQDFDLTPSDIAFVRRNPNTKVFIENTYYYINQILFEANQNLRKLARVELITVEDQINIPHDPEGHSGASSDEGVSPFFPPGSGPTGFDSTPQGNNEGADINNGSILGGGNTIGGGTRNVIIVGSGNRVDAGLKNVHINNGNNNTVKAGGVMIANRDDLTVKTPDISVDGDTLISDGKTELLFNKIDGGRNVLRSPHACSELNKLTGGDDELLDQFNCRLITKIDSDDGIINEL